MTAECERRRCSQCKMEYFTDEFYTNRLGDCYKTCRYCCDKNRYKTVRYQSNVADGSVNIEHGKICVRDGERISREAQKFGFKIVDPTDYKNAKTHTIWECLSCGHHFRRQWYMIRKSDTCSGTNHESWIHKQRFTGKDPVQAPTEAPKAQQLTDDEVTELIADLGI